MLRMSPTVLQLSPRDIERFLIPKEEPPPATDYFTPRLRADADTFTPGRTRAGSAADAAGESFPTPSPHLDRYPLLLRPQGQRPATSQARPRPPRYSPSPSIAEGRRRNVSQLSARVRQRAEHARSDDVASIALRHEHSPLEELMNELNILQDSFPAPESQRLERQRRAEQSPASITISQVPKYDYPSYQGQHQREQSQHQGPDIYQPYIETPRPPPSATPVITETLLAAEASARRRVQVYHDSPFALSDPEGQEADRKSGRHRPAASQHEASSPQDVERHYHRHTYPQHEISVHRHNTQSQPENDEYAQLQALVNLPVRAVDLNTTPPVRSRYEHYAEPHY